MLLIQCCLARPPKDIAPVLARLHCGLHQNGVNPELRGATAIYGSDTNDNFHRAGVFVDKILKGAKPGDIPFELPTRYNFVVNRKTANTLGIKPINEPLVRADKVIE